MIIDTDDQIVPIGSTQYLAKALIPSFKPRVCSLKLSCSGGKAAETATPIRVTRHTITSLHDIEFS